MEDWIIKTAGFFRESELDQVVSVSSATMNRFWKTISSILALIAAIHVYEKVFGPPLPGPSGESSNMKPKPIWVRCSKNETDRYVISPRSRVLVTGGAGFIGAAVMAKLGETHALSLKSHVKRNNKSVLFEESGEQFSEEASNGPVVVGLDNFNNYYSPIYKRAQTTVSQSH